MADDPATTTAVSTFEKYEMWAAKILAALLTAAYATGLIPTDGTVAKIAAMVATALGFLGFAVVKAKQS